MVPCQLSSYMNEVHQSSLPETIVQQSYHHIYIYLVQKVIRTNVN